MNWPPVTIIIITWNRPREIRQVINALQDHFKYDGEIKWLIADDKSPGDYVEQLKLQYPFLTFSITNRGGWGKNANFAMRNCQSDYIFFTEDDYVTKQDLDINCGVAILEKDSDIALIRYDGLAGHRLTLQLEERETRIGRKNLIVIDKQSPFAYIYSNRPHLKHKRFHKAYGEYPEGLSLAKTEESFVFSVKNSKGGPLIAALQNGIEGAFDHIGKSWKESEFDICK